MSYLQWLNSSISCSFLPEHHTIPSRQSAIFFFRPFWGEGETKMRHGQVSGILRTQSGPWGSRPLPAFGCRALHPAEPSAPLGAAAHALPHFFLCTKASWGSLKDLDLCVSFLAPYTAANHRVSLSLLSHYLSDTSHFLVTPTSVSESSVPLFQCP